jgi:hypothetical protein
MTHKGKDFKVILKDIAEMTVGTNPKEIWRVGRKNKNKYGLCFEGSPFKKWLFESLVVPY